MKNVLKSVLLATLSLSLSVYSADGGQYKRTYTSIIDKGRTEIFIRSQPTMVCTIPEPGKIGSCCGYNTQVVNGVMFFIKFVTISRAQRLVEKHTLTCPLNTNECRYAEYLEAVK